MSSQPDNPQPGRKRVQFEQWRKIMLLGAFILLGNAVVAALMDDEPPRWISMLLLFVGYGLLAVGFGTRMRQVKEARAKAAETRAAGSPGSEG